MKNSRIENKKRFKQGIDYRLSNGKVSVSDLDAVIEINDKYIVFMELKYNGKQIPLGQSLLLTRMADVYAETGRKAIVLHVNHQVDNPEEDVILAEQSVVQYYYEGNWHTPRHEYDVECMLGVIGEKWGCKKLSGFSPDSAF